MIIVLRGLILLFSFCPLTNFASSLLAQENIDFRQDKWSLNVSLGYLAGESNEYVYFSGEKVSQLNWKIKQAAIIKGEMNYDLFSWLTANINGWNTLDNGQAVMDDYDWLNPYQTKWSHWSHHENTSLNDANEVDLNLRGWVFQSERYKLGIAAGHERDAFSFSAKGGCFQYDNGLFTGCLPQNEPVIGYSQVFETNYVGLIGKYLIHDFEFNAVVKLSPWVRSSDVDEHYLRNITFKEYGNNSNFYSAGIAAGYYVSHNVKVFAEGSLSRFTNGKADMKIMENNFGESYYIQNAAGLANNNYVISIGVQYRFRPTY
jgi:plasminogen activator